MERKMVDEQEGEHEANTDKEAQPVEQKLDEGSEGADEGDPED